MKKQNNAKFFCENCGAEVSGNSKFCKKCGRFFAAVRCPQCGETGTSEKFKNGCPSCGYAMPDTKNIKHKEEKNHISRDTKKRFISAIDGKSEKNKRADGSLPVWSYFLILFVFALFILGTYFYLKNS